MKTSAVPFRCFLEKEDQGISAFVARANEVAKLSSQSQCRRYRFGCRKLVAKMSLATWKSFGGIPEQARWMCASCKSENQVRTVAKPDQQIVFIRVCEMNN